MEEKGAKTGVVVIVSILVISLIAIIGIVFYVVANASDENPDEKRTLEKMEKEEQDKKSSSENLKNIKTFENVIQKLEYIEDKDLYKYQPIEILKEDTSTIYNSTTGKKIFNDCSFYEWYGHFGIIVGQNDNSYIINENGDILFETKEDLDYYPQSKIWYLDDNIYNSDGLVEKNAYIVDENGKYFLVEKDNQLVLEDYKLKEIYTLKLDSDDSIAYGNLYGNIESKYAVLATEKYNIIVNVENGKEVHKNEDEEINPLGDNIIEMGDNTYYIKDDKLALKVEGIHENIEVSSKYIAIGNKVFDRNTLKEVDSNTYIPEYEEAYIESITGLEKKKCRAGYGLSYKGEELFPCEYDTIDYFDAPITNALISSNKLYIVISKENYEYEIYDVFNKKTVLYNIDNYDTSSPFISIYQDENIYVYNIIDGSKTANKNGDDTLFGPSYFILTDDKYDVYYNKDFKEILKLKISD